MKKFFINANRNCLRRNADAQKIYDYLVANNWEFTRKIHLADLIIVCTCASIEYNENLSADNIKEVLKKKSKSAEVIITGCLPKIKPEIIHELGSFKIVPPRCLDDFDEILNLKVKMRDIPENGAIVIPDFVRKEETLLNNFKNFINQFSLSTNFIRLCIKNVKRMKDDFTPSYVIRIAKGCLGKCTYCCIRVSTGRLESRPLNEIIKQFERGLKKGYKLFKITGIDTGCYGLDTGTDTKIFDLLKRIYAFDGDYKLIITDFNPQWLIKYSDELLPLFLENANRLKEMEIPIQSGCNRILRLMRRPYKIEDVKTKLEDLKKKLPDLRIKTHIIVGFPGETTEDFNETKKFLQELSFRFYGVGVYEYCDRPTAESSEMKEKIPEKVIQERAKILLNIVQELHTAH